MKVLVLGGNGFIGSHIVDALQKTYHSVRVFDRFPEKFRDPLPGVDYRFGDFNDTFLLAEALEGVDAVYHLISTTTPGTSNLDPVSDVKSNLVGSVNLLNNMKEANVRKIIFLSSGGTVYGNPETLPISEEDKLNPICSYGVVKVAIEKYLYMYEHLYDFKTVIIRASNPYGPRQGHDGVQGVIGTFLKRAINNQDIEIWGDGSVMRDYLYITDLVRLCLSALEETITGVFNVGSGELISVNDIVELIDSLLGKKSSLIYRKGRDFDVHQISLDFEKAKKTYGWAPNVDLRDGVALYYDWMNRSKKPIRD